MAFENNPNATASVTLPEPVIVEPETSIYFEGFDTSKGGWGFVAPSPSDFFWKTGGRTTGKYTLYSETTNFTGKAVRTFSGLTVGRAYTFRAWAGSDSSGRQVRLGVTGIGSSAWVSGFTSTYSWKEVAYTFTATATSHELVLEAAKLTTGNISNTVDFDDISLSTAAVTSSSSSLQLSDGDLTLDSSRYPYAAAAVEVPFTSEDLLEQIKPGQRVIINATSEGAWNPTYTPWTEQRRNLVGNPTPAVTTGWSGPYPGTVTADGYTVTHTATTTPYIFSTASTVGAVAGHVYAFRAKVKALPAAGSVFTSVNIRPHKNVGNVYYNLDNPVVIPADGEEQEVAFYWTATADIPASENFNLSIVGNGTGVAGSVYSMRDVLIEDMGLVRPEGDPAEYFAPSNAGDLTQSRFTGTANASASVLETREVVRVDWVPDAGITADLTLRERKVSHDGKNIQLRLESDEALLEAWADIVDDKTPRQHESDLRSLVNYVLNKAIPGAALQPGTANANVTAQWDATNLLKNPGATGSVKNWTSGSGNTTLSWVNAAGVGGGAGYARGTQAGATGAMFLVNSPSYDTSAKPGQLYTVSAYARHSVNATVSITLRFLDADNKTIKNIVSPVQPITTAWERYSVTGVAPPNTAKVAPYLSIFGSASGRTWDVDQALLTEGPELLPYFDGGTPDTTSYVYDWDGDALDSSSTRTATPERLPELFTWEAGQTAWDFLAPLVASAGLRLFCDEQRRWYLIDPNNWTVPGRFSARPDNTVEGTDTMDADDDESGYTGVVAVFKWTDPTGISRVKKDAAGVKGKVKVLEFETPFIAGIAAAHLAKIQGLGRVQDVTTRADYTVRPGMEVQIDLPGTNAQLGTLTRVQWELTNGLQNLQSAGLRDTPPGSIDLLNTTIDGLPGSIDSL